jgi:hypothetical protein
MITDSVIEEGVYRAVKTMKNFRGQEFSKEDYAHEKNKNPVLHAEYCDAIRSAFTILAELS